MADIVPGTVKACSADTVTVTVDRKSACAGCHAVDVCHGLTESCTDFELSRPQDPVQVGDTVRISLESIDFLKACIYAFFLPLAAIVLGMSVGALLGLSFALQALLGGIALAIILPLVRRLGRTIRGPKIIEVIREK